MAWIKVDERFFLSPMVLHAGPLGGMLYLYGLTYCMQFNLDVFPRIVSDHFWGRFYGEAEVEAAIAELVKSGGFVEAEDGWLIVHQWVEEDVVIEGPGEWGCADVIAVCRASATECAFCGSTEELQVDHIVPRSRGGCSRPDNLQILCRRCNTKKRSAVPWGALGGGRP